MFYLSPIKTDVSRIRWPTESSIKIQWDGTKDGEDDQISRFSFLFLINRSILGENLNGKDWKDPDQYFVSADDAGRQIHSKISGVTMTSLWE